ncbi:ASCH domain-containing protein [Auraticoccus monumenti]|uniref:Uncharacterized protein YhfF n=1 Tax=Auraticoccus monumenti TaxID=675864 RepID=A0A1G6S455_9ACTN|nr:ASCH domain-containing protein [Auraticoccus monumenti]SDD11481.1 Uncharacterized protein YhfF [Auraticoccus monumenti]
MPSDPAVPPPADDRPVADPEEIRTFWAVARSRARLNPLPAYFGPTPLEAVVPPAWSFGATSDQADALLALVLAGTKTATAGAAWDYEAEDVPLPLAGTLAIVLDGAAHPRALVETTDVRVVPFDQVDPEHALLEGEGDGSLERWREEHRRFFTAHSTSGRQFALDMPVVLERFRLVHPVRRKAWPFG